MVRRFLFGDIGHQAFEHTQIMDVIKKASSEEIAFVFITNEKGKKIRVAVAAYNRSDPENKFSEPIYVSTKGNSKKNISLTKKELEEAAAHYMERLARQGFPDNPDCDNGIVHDKGKLCNWMEVLENKETVRLFIGINEEEKPDFQNVMLVDEEKFDDPEELIDDEYAYDKGTGCCA